MDMRTVIVEDDALSAEYLRILCEDVGAEVIGIADNGDAAIDTIFSKRPAWVLMDLRLGSGKDGVDVAHRVHAAMPETKVIYVTAYTDFDTLARIATDHPHRVLFKPTVPEHLAEAFGRPVRHPGATPALSPHDG